MADTDILDRAVVARIPVLVKARTPEASGRRIVEVEASTEEVDTDGDVVLQKALVDSAPGFIATGHLDIDHLSEFGQRMGIPDPSSYIVGRPLSVKAMPNQRTFVEGEIRRGLDGDDPARNRYDELWASLRSDPPVQWFASIYGFPIDLDDCRKAECASSRASRFVIKSIDWRSLAFTRTPKNTALKSAARIITAKAFLVELVKSQAVAMGGVPPGPPADMLAVPDTMDNVYAAASDCLGCGVNSLPSLVGYQRHFAQCKGMAPETANIFAHALMYRRAMETALKCTTA